MGFIMLVSPRNAGNDPVRQAAISTQTTATPDQRLRPLWRRLRIAAGRVFCCVLAWSVLVPAAMADEGRFEVLAARTDLREGVYYLQATVAYDFPASAQEALRSGVTLTLEVQIEVERQRRWWTDKGIATLRQRYSLEYHSLSQRYVVRNLNSGEQRSFANLAMAEEALGEIRDLPVIDETLLDGDSRYRVYIRAVLDIRRLPVPLRLFAAFLDDWRISSEWFSWRLR